MTYILVDGAGHFVSVSLASLYFIAINSSWHQVERDRPVLVKKIVEHWIENRAFE